MSARSYDINVFKKQRNIVVASNLTYSTDRRVYLHGHLIFSLLGSEIILSSCGYQTATTKTAINRALTQLGLSNRITQVKGIWYMTHFNNNHKTPFYDGIKLDSFGNIKPAQHVKKPDIDSNNPWQK